MPKADNTVTTTPLQIVKDTKKGYLHLITLYGILTIKIITVCTRDVSIPGRY